jgi:tetratricopeptide (TPR) repeat protein
MLVTVQHPNIVQYRESGQVDGDYYYAMEFVENSLLKCMRGAKDFDLADKILILRQTTSALAAIHHQGIVHRDIKPGNILLDQDANGAIHVKLTDLGIAKNVSETDIVHEQMPTRVPGTAKYLCPEQIRMQAVDGRADIFSLGVLAYELISGTVPFKADTPEQYLVANRTQTQVPAHVVNEDVPKFAGEMIERMLTKDREERYDSDTLSRDLELAQQHLVSGAPMVEHTDPASMFYESALSEAEEPEEPRGGLSPVCWLLAIVFVIAGGVVTLRLWPRRAPAEDAPHARAGTAETGPAGLIARAEAATGAGRYWEATALLRALGREGVPPDLQGRFERVSAQAQELVAETSYDAAVRMLSEGRADEAGIVLRRMKEFAPLARKTVDLAAAISRPGRDEAPTRDWDSALRETYALVRSQHYAEALEARKRLLTEFADQPDKAEAARRAVGDLLDHWARQLAQKYPAAGVLEDFLGKVAAHRDISSDRPSEKLLAQLRLQLARAYRDRGDYDLALKQYELVIRVGDADLEAKARQGQDEVRSWMDQRPHEADVFAGELARRGFASALWRARTNEGGSQQTEGGVLRLGAEPGPRQTVVRRETTRPIRNLGFTAGVQFRLTESRPEGPVAARVGLAVVGTKGSSFELSFDGRSYLVAKKSGEVSAGGVVRKAFGDEDRAWHTMAVAYEFDTGLLAVLVDGEKLLRYSLDLSDFRFSLFLAAPPETAAGAEFKGVFFQP